jgi:S-adenosylmethionine synthetase
MVNTDGSGALADTKLVEIVRQVFPLTPKGIINHLDLRRPIFRKTAAYGHFGRALPEFTWEQIDKVEELKRFA